MATSRLYYDPAKSSAFSTYKNFRVAVKKENKKLGDIRARLEKQDAYTLHRPLRKRFERNPYSVNNVMDLWDCDLVDVRALDKFNDRYVYILSAKDVFSKFLHMVPLRSKTGTAVTSAFQSIFKDPRYVRRRPVGVRIVKGKDFLNKHFQAMLKREGIQFQVCKSSDVKSSVIHVGNPLFRTLSSIHWVRHSLRLLSLATHCFTYTTSQPRITAQRRLFRSNQRPSYL